VIPTLPGALSDRRARGTVRALHALLAAGVLAYAASTIPGLRPAGLDHLLDDLLYSGLLVGAATLCLLRAALVEVERRPWLILGIGLALWAAGDIYYTVYLTDLAEVPFPSLADWLWLAIYPAAYVSLVMLVRGRSPRFHASLWLDGLLGGLATAALASALLLDPIIAATGGDTLTVAFGLAYPIADLLLLALIVAVFGLTGWRPGRSWLLIGGGLIAFAIADSLYLLQLATDSYVVGTPLDAIWPLALVAIAFSAWQSTTARVIRVEGGPLLTVPAVFALIALGVVIYDQLAEVGTVSVVLAIAALSAVMVRTLMTFRELQQLNESRHQARTDALTGLANRRHILAQLAGAIERAEGRGQELALLLLDLDGFKELNDTLGHHVGDLLLEQLGPRLQTRLRGGDLLARLGGDEFGVLLATGTTPAQARVVAERLREAISEPFDLEDIPVQVDASIGMAFYPKDARDATSLLQHSDIAMYQAKNAHTGVEAYVAERNRMSPDRLALAAEIGRALKHDELVLHYQPQIAIDSGEVVGAEALLRWQHPTRGLLLPGEFVPVLEQTRLMDPLTQYVIKQALHQSRSWRAHGIEVAMAVNLAPANLSDVELPGKVAGLLDECGVPGGAFTLEVTEGAVMTDTERAIAVLEELHRMGVRISLDDFGTGYSSLAYLHRLPVGQIKIDRSFVMSMDQRTSAAIVRSTIELARSLDLPVIAEGVETEESLARLREWGCDTVQGFLFARPMPAESFREWVANRPTRSPVRAGTDPAARER